MQFILPIKYDLTSCFFYLQIPRRHGSIFEGASKYEILHYLKDAKVRIGHGDFEMGDLDNETNYPLKRNHNHRVSAISNLSDSSDDSRY